MILDELVLHNFGIFGGRQALRLTPPNGKQPITLFGGLNGAGKTTLLDALQLALYGKLARCTNRGSRAYASYLRRCIHRGVSATDGTALEVEFRRTVGGRKRRFRVHRSWYENGKGIRENVEVFLDGQHSRAFTETWQEFMEDLLPVRVANLFFFDGERIEQFADPATSSELLSKAVHSLLGLDLVDQLTTDLVALERRKRVKTVTDDEKARLDEINARLERLDHERKHLGQERASAKNKLDRIAKKLREVELRFQSEGGVLFEERAVYEQERSTLQERVAETAEQLRELAHGVAPLYLVPELLDQIAGQSRLEKVAEEATLLSNLLLERDRQLARHLGGLGVSANQIREAKAYLSADRKKRRAAAKVRAYLHLDEPERLLLESVRCGERTATAKLTRDLLRTFEALATKLEEVDRILAAIPDEAAIAALIVQRRQLRAEHVDAERAIRRLDCEIDRTVREEQSWKTRFASALDRIARQSLAQHNAKRLILHSARARGTLTKFRQAVVERHTTRLEALILESFRRLVRKRSLVSRLSIDPKTFALELYSRSGEKRTPDRLSAGERQLLAIAILWGLARACGRKLPVVIDTPVGRLDSVHRSNLVQRYFPKASHQVLLLSTDEEIDQHFYDELQPSIGRSYLLQYDEAVQSTAVQDGYFWGSADGAYRNSPVVAAS